MILMVKMIVVIVLVVMVLQMDVPGMVMTSSTEPVHPVVGGRRVVTEPQKLHRCFGLLLFCWLFYLLFLIIQCFFRAGSLCSN